MFLSDRCFTDSSHSFQVDNLMLLNFLNFLPVYEPGHEILVLIAFAAARASMQSH